MARCLLSALVLALVVTPAGSAWASFPGRNGKIVYEWVGESAFRAGPTATSVRAVDPRTGRIALLRDCPVLTAPVSHTDCAVSAPRYSPDGLRIAFPTLQFAPGSSGQPPRPGLATMAPDGAGFEEHATSRRFWALAWSSAGDRLLVQRQLGAEGGSGEYAIFLTSVEGSELSRVTPKAAQTPDWSSTGQIAFTQCRNPCSPSEIYLTRLGGTPRRLTYRGGYDPSWSPHGSKLAFVRTDRSRQDMERRDIYTVRRDGRRLRRLTYRGGTSPAWSPDGRWIAFVRAGNLYVVRTTGRGLRRLVDAPPLEFGSPFVASLDWQPRPPK